MARIAEATEPVNRSAGDSETPSRGAAGPRRAGGPAWRTSRPAYVEAVVGELRRRMLDLPDTLDIAEELGSPVEAAERIVMLIPKRSAWSDVVGPVYTQQQVRRLTGAGSRQALADRVARRTLLGLRTSDGHVVYPVFQFRGTQVLPGLSKVLQAVGDSVDGWTLASWLRAPQPGLAGQTVLERLVQRSKADQQILDVTRTALERWSH